MSATLHSHVAGRKMKLRHIRDGAELSRIVEDDNYDYDFQQVRQLVNETKVLPGDYMITDCAYEVCICLEGIFTEFNKTLFRLADVRTKASYIWRLLNEARDVSVVHYVLSEN